MKNRIITGIAPDGMPSATHASSKFINYSEMLKARRYAYKQFGAFYGIYLSKPPNMQPGSANMSTLITGTKPNGDTMIRSLTVDVSSISTNRSIGSGLTVPSAKRPITSPQHPAGMGISSPHGRIYDSRAVEPINSTITKVTIGLTWSVSDSRWIVGQFFPAP